MQIRRCATLLLLLIALPATAAEWIGQLPEAERRAVEAAAEEADANWNARDAAALAAMYSDDATLLVGGREPMLRGREAVLAYFPKSFARAPASLHHTTTVDRMIVLAPDLVWADTRVALDDIAVEGTAVESTTVDGTTVDGTTVDGTAVEGTADDGRRTRVRDFHTLTLLRRTDGQWKLHAVRAFPVPATPTAR